MHSLEKRINSSDGINLCYTAHHGRKKTWLVFIHGFRVNCSVFTEYINYFEKKGYSTLTYDLRGHGLSGKPKSIKKYNLERYSQDLHELLKKEKIPKCILIGYSMGGTVALDYYNKYPQNVSKLVLISTTDEFKKGLKKSAGIYLPLTMGIFDSIREIYSRFFKKRKDNLDFSKLKNKDALEVLFEISKDNMSRLNFPEFAAISFFNASSVPEKINIPTLIIGGDSDELFSLEAFNNLHMRIKKSKLKIFNGGHTLVFENPNPLIKEMEKFIQSSS